MAIEALVPGIAVALAKAVGRRVATGGELLDDSLIALAESVGEAASGAASSRRGSAKVQRALEKCLRAALREVEEQHGDFRRLTGGFDWGFLEMEATAEEMAKALIVGERPDPGAIAGLWSTSLIASVSPELRVRAVSAAIGPASTLVERWEHHLAISATFEGLMRKRSAAASTDALERLVAASGGATADKADEFVYLEEVCDEHRFVDVPGLEKRRLPLDSVYSPLGLLGHAEPDDATRRRIDIERRAIEADASLSEEEIADRVDSLLADIEADDFAPREIGSVLSGGSRTVVLGEPGAGKSTLARWLAFRYAAAGIRGERTVELGRGGPERTPSQEWRFPIFVRAASLVARTGWESIPLIDFLVDDHRARNYSNPERIRNMFLSKIEKGLCLLILDGIDEVPSASDRRAVVDRVSSAVGRWQARGNAAMVTSRPAGYWSHPLPASEHYVVSPLSLTTDVARFVGDYCAAIERLRDKSRPVEQARQSVKGHVSAVIRCIRESRGLERFATNPLLLTILIMLEFTDASLPHQRAVLYDRAIGQFERGWRLGQGVDEEALPDPYLMRVILLRLAVWVHELRPAGIVDFDDILEAVGVEWAVQNSIELLPGDQLPALAISRLDEFVSKVVTHSGVLSECAPRRWKFFHQTFQEYYVAQWLVQQPNIARSLRVRLHDPRFREPLLLALGIVTHVSPRGDAAQIAEAALFGRGPLATEGDDVFGVGEYEDLLGRDTEFAFAAACDEVQMRGAVLAQLADAWLVTPNSPLPDRTRFASAVARALLSQGAWWRKLREAAFLGDPDGVARSAIVEASPDLQWPSVFDVLLAISDAASTGTRDVGVEKLLRLAAEVQNGVVQREAIRALADLGDARAATLDSLDSLLSTPAKGARAEAARALGRLARGRLQSASLLVECLEGDQAPQVRKAAARSLGSIGLAEASVVATLRSAVRSVDENPHVRSAAIRSLVRLGQADADLGQMLKVLADDGPHPELRATAIRAMPRCPYPSEDMEALLTRYLNERSHSDERRAAAQALGQLGGLVSSSTVELLRELVDPADPRTVQDAAAFSLVQISDGADETTDVLARSVDDGAEPWMLRATTRALGRLVLDTETGRALFRRYASSHWLVDVRRVAAESLAASGALTPPHSTMYEHSQGKG